nr:protein FAM183A isoform X1 [Chlorocebus sabaeus]
MQAGEWAGLVRSAPTGQHYQSAVAWRPRDAVAWRQRGRAAWRLWKAQARGRGAAQGHGGTPKREVHTITRKPMSWHDNLEEPADARFLNLIHHTAQGPRKKYPETQTENQEVGWDLEPLVNPERHDRRLNHFRVCSDITLYKAKTWGLGDDRHK